MPLIPIDLPEYKFPRNWEKIPRPDGRKFIMMGQCRCCCPKCDCVKNPISSIDYLLFTMAGSTNGACVGCNGFDGSYVMQTNPSAGICDWTYSPATGSGAVPCPSAPGGFINLGLVKLDWFPQSELSVPNPFPGDPNGFFRLVINLTTIYAAPASTWKCFGTNTLTKISSGASESCIWPSTVTVRPSTTTNFFGGSCPCPATTKYSFTIAGLTGCSSSSGQPCSALNGKWCLKNVGNRDFCKWISPCIEPVCDGSKSPFPAWMLQFGGSSTLPRWFLFSPFTNEGYKCDSFNCNGPSTFTFQAASGDLCSTYPATVVVSPGC